MYIAWCFKQAVLGMSLAATVAVATPAAAQTENADDTQAIPAGSLYAWGDGLSGMQYIPAGSNFVAVAGGTNHHIALKADGSVVAWGDNTLGQLNVPLGKYSAISARSNYSLALRLDGSIAAWGEDRDGIISTAPKDSGYVAISAGRYHAIALHADGSIVSWGNNEYGQVDDTPDLADLGEGLEFEAISAGSYHSLALLNDGSIEAWGRDNYRQVTDTPVGNNFIAISGGGWSNLALRGDGTIVGWGYDQHRFHDYPGVLSGIPTEGGFVAISISGGLAMALKADGSIVQWPKPADPAVHGSFIAVHEGAAPIGIAEANPFNPSRPVDPTGRFKPVAEGLLDTTTNLIWGFGSNEVNFYLKDGGYGLTWQYAQTLPIVDLDGNITYQDFSNKFFGRNDKDWRLPTIEEMQAAYVADLIDYLDASPRPGFQRLGYIGTSNPVAQRTCCSSTKRTRDSGWWLNFETGESFSAMGSYPNYIAVRPATAPTDGGGVKGGGGKK
jgi:hypothetical protein